MKKILVFASLLAASLAMPARAQSVFSDVPDNHWAAAAVRKLAAAGIIEGRPASVKHAASTRSATAPRKTGATEARENARRKTVAARVTPRAKKLKTGN